MRGFSMKKNNKSNNFDLKDEDLQVFLDDIKENLEIIQELFLKYEKENLTKIEFDDLKRKIHILKGSAAFLKLNNSSEVAHILENILDGIEKGQYSKEEIINLLIEAVGDLIDFFNKFSLSKDLKEDKEDKEINLLVLLEKLRLFKETDISEKEIVEEIEKPSKEKKASKKEEEKILIKKEYKKYDYDSYDKNTLNDFLSEANEMLSDISQTLLELEKDYKNKEVINDLFRVLHTLKGSSGMVGLLSINYIAHALEEILDFARNDTLVITSQIVDVMFSGIDKIQELIKKIETGKEPNENVDKLLTKIYLAKENKLSEEISIQKDEVKEKKGGEQMEIEKEEIKTEVKEKTEAEKESKQTSTSANASTVQQSLRIDVKKLDNVMNQMGELVIEKIRLHEFIKEFINYGKNIRRLKKKILSKQMNVNELVLDIMKELDREADKLSIISESFDRISTNLQESVMQMRLVPISQIFTRFPRIVRDLSKKMNKKINFIIEGEETEIDKGIIEKLMDPLIHIIRNSIDHGIETEEKRKSIGKKPEGTLYLKAYYKGDKIVIEIEDDGAGLNLKKIKEKAVQKGLIDKEAVERLDKDEIISLIFQPGFSTADTVTDLSGRGVGMDVVKTTIEGLNGTISIKSEEKKGTTIQLLIPLTLAIMEVLLIKSVNRTLAIPLYIIQETVFCKKKEIYELGHKIVFNLRGIVIPLIVLNELLGIEGDSLFVKASGDTAIPIVVIKLGEKYYGIIVDLFEGKQEIVLKTLGSLLQKSPFVNGATIMGDGNVILILDVLAIIREANKYSFQKKESKESIQKQKKLAQRKKALVVDDALPVRLFLKKILSEEEFEVDEAENGKVALYKAKEKKYDLFTIDFLMPEMDGYELCQELRKIDKYKKTPMIAISSKSEKVDKIKGFEVGIDEYLVKPVERDLFVDVVKKYIE